MRAFVCPDSPVWIKNRLFCSLMAEKKRKIIFCINSVDAFPWKTVSLKKEMSYESPLSRFIAETTIDHLTAMSVQVVNKPKLKAEELAGAIDDADVLVVRSTEVPCGLYLDRKESLRW